MANSTVFALPEYRPYLDRYNMRAARFGRLRRYYDGTIYSDSAFKYAHKLYAQTKSLFAFLARAVDLDGALVPGVMGPWALMEGTPENIFDAQRTLYDWSMWAIGSDDWVEDGATLGEAAIKIVPVPEMGKVTLQRLRPEWLYITDDHMDMETGQKSDIAIIVNRSYMMPDGGHGEYAEVITPSMVRTYLNGEPFGFNGNPDRYPNPLLFVPIVTTMNDAESRPTFAKCMDLLTSVNELASYIADIIGRHAEPQYIAEGIEPSEMTRSGTNIWFTPSGSSIDALVADIDVAGSLAFIQDIKIETKANLPELVFDDLRSKDQIAFETLDTQIGELSAKIWKMRRRYDAGLIAAHRMAAIAAEIYGIRDISPLLEPHEMNYARQVMPVSRLQQIRLEEAEIALSASQALLNAEGMTV